MNYRETQLKINKYIRNSTHTDSQTLTKKIHKEKQILHTLQLVYLFI